jgi:hypothetical protein
VRHAAQGERHGLGESAAGHDEYVIFLEVNQGKGLLLLK